MFEIGALVVYGSVGVCRVEGVSAVDEQQPQKLYFHLKPLFGSETIYAPVGGKIPVRPVLSREEAEALLARIPEIPERACENRDLRSVSNYCESFFQAHSCEALLQFIKTLYLSGRRVRNGRRMSKVEEKYFKRAEDLLYSELSVSLSLPREELQPAIQRRMREAACAPAGVD